ncbi:hypothetical protein [Salinilacihabitans rarus]|uniref:hypothetical protein n=1 Tax=Salinilacihabitans rarus TaxID=2961596 RepID=UPI0020C866A1|nr:hypothetical protein [Salinilacihabitans rarus]
MASHSDADATASPLEFVRRVIGRAWRDLLSVFYTNTPIWRLLKSVGLLFFGFFCWSASNLLFSYGVDWTILQYVRAYGFVLIFWGPLTHAVIVPYVIRLRRNARRPLARTLARQGSKLTIAVFLVLVLVLGTYPIGAMTLDFGSSLQGGDGGSDVDPDLLCTQTDGTVDCRLSESDGIDHVVVLSGDREVDRADEPPFEVAFHEDDLEEVVGQKEFVVELRDEDGDTLRRYRRSVATIPEG